ncbi:phage/plasmid primase, P4 family [Tepidanaerobacter acetatoxydans]|jgi:P4 family phage/plasmid primase-like protien|uniref:DNA primase family protein n=1 Tax=Tepidanaerobacter acetatoxydans TaxID=499229 RepID=UPI0026EF9665|nr:DNA primase family protein [Tepidanaerobacter acetatoxydans]
MQEETSNKKVKPSFKYDGVLTIATGRSRKELEWKNREMLWSELVKKLSATTRTHESCKEYKKLPKVEKDRIKDVGGFVGGTLKGGRRKADCVVWRQIVTLDADFVKGDLWAGVEVMFGRGCCMYSTHSHTPSAPRLRLVIPLKRPVSPDEYQAVSRRIAGDLGIDFFDDTTYEAHRLMYWPSTSEDGEFIFKYLDEEWADPDEILARYPDWKDPSYWPESSQTKAERKKLADKQGDPREKPGIVGAFCRTYTIAQVIEKFLSDVYAPGDDPSRYTYIPGSTAGGLVLYDRDNFAYSYHATDPICGKLCNAFDLVRLHKFGDLDDDAKEGTPVNKLPSYMAMQELAEKDEMVRKTLDEERLAAMDRDFKGEEVDPQDMFFEKRRFIPMYLADWFLMQHEAIVIQDELYIYENGRYVDGDRVFREKATNVLGPEFQTNRLNEALNYIKNTVLEVHPNEAATTGEYLNVRNGLLNLETLEFVPHTPELHTIIQLPVEYNPDAKCPAIDKFLNMVAKDSIPVIEEMLGYCLIPSMKYEATFLLYGEGGNGKGTLIALIGELFGKDNTSNIALQSLTENRFLTAELFGKMVNLYADIPNRIVEDSSLFKTLTSGDSVQAEKKHKPPFSFCNRAKLIFSANELPSSRDNSEGYHRRWIVIPFNNKFNDRELRQSLFCKEELEGLLIKAIKGLKRLKAQDGFSDIASVKHMSEKYREKSDSVYKFLKECCILDPKSMVGKQELYDTYRRKCGDWGCYPVNQSNFNNKVKTVYSNVAEYRRTPPRRWKGLKLDPKTDEMVDG